MPGSISANHVPCPDDVQALVERFGRHIEVYKQSTYNETQVRREFIDPLFIALGWDVDNKAGFAEQYKDVIHEDAIKVGGSTKAPDYCFRIGGARKFFVEAKKPSVSVSGDPGPAYQVRRYAWSNKLPLSLVTDFEEFAVYDCRIKPKLTDPSSTARVLYLTYDQYPTRWGEIASIFAKDAILKGSFDKYAESNKRKRGTAEVDDEFLKEIEGWREELARNIALRNPGLPVRELNYAVGKIVDRIVFLRMCEDRGVETYAQLRTLPNGPNIYPRLVELFRRADERYNSGLFHFEVEKDRYEPPDELTPQLAIDDRVLKDIIKSLYYPDCPYEFSVMPPEILGQVYEQFLGKVIRLTKGHRAVVEEKPEVRKAGGVYYTPKYIVDYIVEHTVGKLLEGKTPAEVGPMLEKRKRSRAAQARGHSPSRAHRRRVNQYRDSDAVVHPTRDSHGEVDPIRAPEQYRDRQGAADASPLTKGGLQGGCLRILDPACGSGSFLLGAYQFLLDWHLKWYTDHDPEQWAKKKTPPIYQSLVRTPSASDRADQYRDSLPFTSLSDVKGHGAVTADQYRDRQGAAHYRLTITEKKRILLNNIYGVDIDPQAVEVTKLSLLLKVLEGENQQSLDNQLRLFHERALPDLGSNIKCGNSLIGPDFYDNRQMNFLDEEERYRINAFDWHAEFPEVFQRCDPDQCRDSHGAVHQNRAPDQYRDSHGAAGPVADDKRPLPHGRGTDKPGGFDAVIGNPPYLYSAGKDYLGYFKAHYKLSEYQTDHYVYFLEKALTLACVGGYTSFIMPDSWLNSERISAVRNCLLTKHRLEGLAVFDYPVFKGVTLENSIPIVRVARDPKRFEIVRFAEPQIVLSACWLDPSLCLSRGIIDPRFSPDAARILSRLETASTPLSASFDVNRGVHAYRTDGYGKSRFGSGPQTKKDKETRSYNAPKALDKTYLPEIRGKHVERYTYMPSGDFLSYGPWLAEPREPRFFMDPKVAVRKVLGKRLHGMLFNHPVALDQSLYVIIVRDGGSYDLRYALGILLSAIGAWYLKTTHSIYDTLYPWYTKAQLAQFPIRTASATQHDRLVNLAQRMLDLHKQLTAAKTPTDKTAVQRQIDATDRQIDQLVYELYGLTDDEVRIVEEAT